MVSVWCVAGEYKWWLRVLCGWWASGLGLVTACGDCVCCAGGVWCVADCVWCPGGECMLDCMWLNGAVDKRLVTASDGAMVSIGGWSCLRDDWSVFYLKNRREWTSDESDIFTGNYTVIIWWMTGWPVMAFQTTGDCSTNILLNKYIAFNSLEIVKWWKKVKRASLVKWVVIKVSKWLLRF